MGAQQRSVPDGVEPLAIEGRDLKMAIAGAAEALGVHPGQVDYKLDLSHFRSVGGVSVARTTVKILAWGSDRPSPADDAGSSGDSEQVADRREEEEVEAREESEKPKRKRRPRKPKGASDESENGVGEAPASREDGEKRPPRDEPHGGAEEGQTEASRYAQEWFEQLLEHMDVDGTVTGTGNESRVHLAIDAERAGRIVGKRGATLGAIRHLLGLALSHRFGELTVDVDVGDDRPREKKPKRDHGERGERGERGDRDRGRGRERSRGRDRDGQGGPAKGKYPEEKLRALARRGAEKALEAGRTFTINLPLNSYDRRVVHLEISEIDGVDSQSEEREQDGRIVKFVQIIPL